MTLGVSPKFQLEEMRYVIGDSRPRILFAIPAFEGREYEADIASLAAEYDIETIVGPARSTGSRCRRRPVRPCSSRRRPEVVVTPVSRAGQTIGAMFAFRGGRRLTGRQRERRRYQPPTPFFPLTQGVNPMP